MTIRTPQLAETTARTEGRVSMAFTSLF